MRSSVDHTTREIMEVAMIVRMNIDAMRMPSGRSMMFSVVVYKKTRLMSAECEPAIALVLAPLEKGHRHRRRRHQHEHAGGVRAALRLNIRLEQHG
jgi:hypothetical protein